MNFINFVVITDTPARLRTFLVNRGIIKETSVGSGVYTGVLPGMEWVRVPNPIQTAPGSGTPGDVGYIPPTYDTRAVFLVKFAHESMADQDDNLTNSPATDDYSNAYDYTRFGRWVKGNSTLVAAPANYTINGEHAGSAYKINNEQVWLVRDRPERFGVWQ